MSAPPPDFEQILSGHGGFHRYHLSDHAYLYNLYFPTPPLVDALKESALPLLRNYPVNQKVVAGLLSQVTGLPSDCLVAGNGAAELIKIISGTFAGKLIIPQPSFNEYANAAPKNQSVAFPLTPPDFDLDPEAFVRQARESGADTAVIVSPNNPTARIVPREDILWMADRFSDWGIRLLVDESFIDFCDCPEAHTVSIMLDRYSNLTVIKSMSKAYGIGGLRLGYAATWDPAVLTALRQGVHIWNINGFAEEFLRQLPGFATPFEESCRKVIHDRNIFFRNLENIPGLAPLGSQANFIFCRLPEDAPPARKVAEHLFSVHRILIKECGGKTMRHGDRYLRIASRTPEENLACAKALKETLEALKEDPT